MTDYLSKLFDNQEEPTTEPPAATEQAGGGTLQRQADKRADDLTRAAAILKEYQEHTAAANALIIEIAKGIKAGEDIHILFLKALEALELTTNNKMIEHTAADFRTIYGAGLHTDSLLTIELEQIQARLSKLEQAAADETISSGERDRISGAIKRHRARIERIKQQIQ